MPDSALICFGYNFQHTQFNTPVFAVKEQTCANFMPFCAIYVPDPDSGTNFSSISMLSLEVYPHRMELNASIASCLLR